MKAKVGAWCDAHGRAKIHCEQERAEQRGYARAKAEDARALAIAAVVLEPTVDEAQSIGRATEQTMGAVDEATLHREMGYDALEQVEWLADERAKEATDGK